RDPLGFVGQTIEGRIRIAELIADGRTSVVYKGHHEVLGVPVAIKFLRVPDAALDAFHEESQRLYELSQTHLHIPRSFACGTLRSPALDADVHYVVREWLEGRSLKEDFAARRARGMHGRRLGEVLALFESAASALAHAHAHSVVHHRVHP